MNRYTVFAYNWSVSIDASNEVTALNRGVDFLRRHVRKQENRKTSLTKSGERLSASVILVEKNVKKAE